MLLLLIMVGGTGGDGEMVGVDCVPEKVHLFSFTWRLSRLAGGELVCNEERGTRFECERASE